MRSLSPFKKAFSLLELSVVVVIIGLIIAGATQGSKMVNSFRLQSAQSLTLSSPVVSTDGLVLWLEPTMPESFIDVETKDGAQITKWIDRNPQATIKLSANSSASAGIVYKEQSDIYGLPSVEFSGLSSAVLTLNNGSSNVPIITSNSAYTLFIVAKLSDDSSTAMKTIFSNGNSSGWGYGVAGSQGNRSRNLIFAGSSDVTSATANVKTKPEVISAFYTGGAGGNIQLFTNGVGNAGSGEAGTSETLTASTATATTPNTAFYLGNKSSAAPWTGLISEVIIFNRVLSSKERNQIELYLGQKYNIKIATTGNIEGCPVNIAGVLETHVGEGASTLSCLADGYSGTVDYDCSGGTLTPGGSCNIFQCAINGETGIINGTMANYATTSTPFNCNDTANGYSGTINYTCTNGGGFNKVSGNCTSIKCTISNSLQPSLNNKTDLAYSASAIPVPETPSTACATGYSGSPTYTCTATGEATIVTPCTAIQCTVGAPAYNSKTLNYTTVATPVPSTPTPACATGYSGSPTYTCTTSGPATITSGACTIITCNVSGVTGLSGVVNYTSTSTSKTCDAGYNGNIFYTCDEYGAFHYVSGSCLLDFYCSSGGSVVNTGGRRIHSFTSSSYYLTTSICSGYTNDLDILVVAGGGGGGDGSGAGVGGGGGGGGGIKVSNNNTVSVTGAFTIEIGSGGAVNANGNNSLFSGNGINISAIGGGRGGYNSGGTNYAPGSISGTNKGSGGGGLGKASNVEPLGNYQQPGGTGTYSGGTGYISGSGLSGGGGGGLCGAGTNGISGQNGKGGAGCSYDTSGASVIYSPGGGGGGSNQGALGTGGNNTTCGGNGGYGNASSSTQSCYGGGGGGGGNSGSPGVGKAGIVIISYPYTP